MAIKKFRLVLADKKRCFMYQKNKYIKEKINIEYLIEKSEKQSNELNRIIERIRKIIETKKEVIKN